MDIKILDRLKALNEELAALREEQTRAAQIVQNCSASIQQHLGAIAVLQELFGIESPNGKVKEEVKA